MGDLQTIANTTNVLLAVSGTAKDNPMQAFIVSILAGCLVPVLPIIAEYGLTNAVRYDTWSLIGIVYAAGVGTASRNKAIVISSFFSAIVCLVFYGADKYSEANHVDLPFVENRLVIAQAVLYFLGVGYVFERFGRHVVEKQPYLE
jgi:hypothetical protein